MEGQNQKGLEGKALADGVALQLLQDLPEIAVAIPARRVSLRGGGMWGARGCSEGAGKGGQWSICGLGKSGGS